MAAFDTHPGSDHSSDREQAPNLDEQRPALAGSGFPWLAYHGVLLVGTIHLACLLWIIHHGTFHPTKYTLTWPRSVSAMPGWWAWGVATIIGLAFAVRSMLVVTHRWRRMASIPSQSRLSGASLILPCILLLVAAPWLVLIGVDQGLSHFRLMWALASILLFAMGFSRLVFLAESYGYDPGASCPSPAEERGATDDDSDRLSWYREPGFLITAAFVAAFSLFHFLVQMRLFAMWQYGSPDVGYYAEMLQSVLRGQGLRCTAFGHFFGEHFSPGLYLLALIYAIYPSIESLMAIGAFAVMSGALAVYAIARRTGLGQMGSAGLGFAYLLYPSFGRMIYGQSYGFHEILIAVPLLLWSYQSLQVESRWRALVLALLALSLKENVAVILFSYGVVEAFRRRDFRGIGTVVAAGSMVYLLVVMLVVVPAFREGGDYSKVYLYEGLGDSPLRIAMNLVTQPMLFIERLWQWRVLGFLLFLLIPLAGFPARRFEGVAALPVFVFIALMTNTAFTSIRFWHQSIMLPVLWIAVIQAVGGGDCYARGRKVAALLISACLCHYALGFSPLARAWQRLPLDAGEKPAQLAQIRSLVSVDDAVQVSPRLGAHFVSQDRVIPWHMTPDPPADWILFDLADRFAGPEANKSMRALIRSRLDRGDYTVRFQVAEVWLLERVDVPTSDP